MLSSDWTTAIDDDSLFIGRKRELESLLAKIYGVVFLIGGRRMGKTSLLYAVKRELKSPSKEQPVPFPVYISFRDKDALSTEQFLFFLIRELRDEMFQSGLWTTPELATIENFLPSDEEIQRESFQTVLLKINTTLQKHYNGIVYLIDDVGYFIGKPWWDDDAANYIRAIKDDQNLGLRSRLGFMFSGFRELKEFSQKVGSKLSEIAVIKPVKCLHLDEVKEACRERCGEMDEGMVAEVLEYAGCHPFLTQYLLTHWHEERQRGGTPSVATIASKFCISRPKDFQTWWNEKGEKPGLSERERKIYLSLLEEDCIPIEEETLSPRFSNYSLNEINDSLTYLSCAGLLTEVEEGEYRMGAKMFQDWVRKNRPNPDQRKNKMHDTTNRTGEKKVACAHPVDVGIIIALREEFTEFHKEIEDYCKPVRDKPTSRYDYLFVPPHTVVSQPYRCVATFVGGVGPIKSGLLTQKLISKWNPDTDEERLAILCADIEVRLKAANVQPPTPVSLEIVGGKGLEGKILNLIERLDKRGLLQYLIDAVREAQPGLI